MDQSDFASVRTIACALALRARSEQTFRENILERPVETLTASGLPEEFVTTFLQETQLGEVSGYELNQQCLISDIGSLKDFIY